MSMPPTGDRTATDLPRLRHADERVAGLLAHAVRGDDGHVSRARCATRAPVKGQHDVAATVVPGWHPS